MNYYSSCMKVLLVLKIEYTINLKTVEILVFFLFIFTKKITNSKTVLSKIDVFFFFSFYCSGWENTSIEFRL